MHGLHVHLRTSVAFLFSFYFFHLLSDDIVGVNLDSLKYTVNCTRADNHFIGHITYMVGAPECLTSKHSSRSFQMSTIHTHPKGLLCPSKICYHHCHPIYCHFFLRTFPPSRFSCALQYKPPADPRSSSQTISPTS